MHVNGEALGVNIGVVAEHTRRRDREGGVLLDVAHALLRVLITCHAIVDSHRRVVNRAHGDDHLSYVRAHAVGVERLVGEARLPVEVERRGEGVVTISGEDHAALRRVRLADELSGEGLAVHVAVVGEHVAADLGVLGGRVEVVDSHRGIVVATHGDRDDRGRLKPALVTDGVLKAVITVEVCLGCVGERAIHVDAERTVGGLCVAYHGEAVTRVDVGVVGEQTCCCATHEHGVLRSHERVSARYRSVVDGGDCDHHSHRV